MKLETPFTGKLAVLGVRGRTGLVLAEDGEWGLKEGAVVNHAAAIGSEMYFPTVIGYIERIAVMPQTYGLTLMAYGHGTSWLADLLDEGSHALSSELDIMVTAGSDVVSGRVAGALLVRADAFGWPS